MPRKIKKPEMINIRLSTDDKTKIVNESKKQKRSITNYIVYTLTKKIKT